MNIEFSVKELFLIFILAIGILFLYFVQSTGFLGEDEATYISVAKDFIKGRYSIFNEFGSQNALPPFYPLLIAMLSFSGLGILALAKSINVIFGLLTAIIIYLITRKFNIASSFSSVSLLLAIPFFTHFMFISYVEIPIAFFSALSLYLFLSLKSVKRSILLGAVLGLSIYVKSSGSFLIISLFFYSFLMFLFKKDKNIFKLITISSIVAVFILTPWVIRNFYLFKYPYVEGLNILFTYPKESLPSWLTHEVSKTVSPSTDFIQFFGQFSLFFMITGAVYYFYVKNTEEKKLLEIVMFISILFLAFYFSRFYMGGIEPRYLSIIFPQLALIGGIFIGVLNKKLSIKNKYFIVVAIVLIIYGFFLSYQVAWSTSHSERYPANYIQALTWIKQNTPEDSVIFTTYGGSVSMFAERKRFWNMMEEFPTVMTTQNSTYVYQNLKKYNVTHVLIWRGVIAENYIMPGTNILGMFTYNFVNTVLNDTEHFKNIYGNEDNVVLELK
jgi:4-amino-4-deoxy-L-arabinose transferase-like glycosyltransferase